NRRSGRVRRPPHLATSALISEESMRRAGLGPGRAPSPVAVGRLDVHHLARHSQRADPCHPGQEGRASAWAAMPGAVAALLATVVGGDPDSWDAGVFGWLGLRFPLWKPPSGVSGRMPCL